MRISPKTSRAALICVALVASGAGAAQEAAIVDRARIYEAETFARFAPRTAFDMVSRVPGFVIAEEEKERGFGQASGNVLINSARISGKNNDVVTELKSIPAANVSRIEIVDGATLDVPGLSGQVANVIIVTDNVSGQFSWSPELRGPHADPLWTKASISVSSATGPFEYTLGFKNDSGRYAAAGPTQIFSPDGALVELRDDAWQKNWERPRASARLVYDGPGEQVGNLNLSYGQLFDEYREEGVRTRADGADQFRIVESDVDSYDYEIGGDYAFAPGFGTLKLIGLKRFEHKPLSSLVQTEFEDGAPNTGNLFARESDIAEQILRAEYGWNIGPAEWQLAIESAFNSLENVSELFTLAPDGSFEEIPLPGGSATVEEERYEAMASWSQPLGAKLSMQVSVGGENSEVAQVGAGGITREFWRPKGLVALAYEATPQLDINMKLQREVGQLDFLDFLANVNFEADQATAANPNLVPPQTWHAEVEAVRDLAAYGRTGIRVYAQLINDIVDTIPIGETGEAPGNIDNATIFGAEWTGTFNLDPFGWSGARLDTQLKVQESAVKDPLTGEDRPISNTGQYAAEIDLRHDVQNTDWAWGAGLDYSKASKDYRLSEVGRVWMGPLMGNVFVEHKDVYGLTVRANALNVLGADSLGDRTVFVDRRTGPVDFIEKRDRDVGVLLLFTVSGTF